MGRPVQRHPGDRPPLRAPGRGRPLLLAAEPHRRPRADGRDGARGERRRRARRRRARAGPAAQVRGEARGAHPPLRRVRRPRGDREHPLGRRWRRRCGLRRDADADVHALGRAQQVPRRGLRHLLRRGGGTEVGHLRDPRAVRLRHAQRRGRHPPAGADQPVRQPGAPADLLRRGRGGAGARADRRDRHPRGGRPGRRLPLQRPGRPVGEHDRLRRTPDPHPDRHRRVLPEREVAAAEQGQRDGDPQGQAAGAEEGRGEGPSRRAARRRAGVAGATRCAATC